jgi:hypothetical protein
MYIKIKLFILKMMSELQVLDSIIIKKYKPISPNNNKPKFKKKTEQLKKISYSDYFKNKNNLEDFKLAELKSFAKQHQLYVSGTKTIIIQRIESFFIKTSLVIKIQKIFRKFIVKQWLLLKGPALQKKSLCVNETDFYTLEPLNEISLKNFCRRDSIYFHMSRSIVAGDISVCAACYFNSAQLV